MSKSIGTVKWFDNDKGFGFIVNTDNEDVFVHHVDIRPDDDDFKTLDEGQSVEFIQTRSKKGWKASEVIPVEEMAESA